MTRSIIFDTETTGLDPATGDRIIEIAALELDRNEQLTGARYHVLINPDRDIPPEATRVHGFTLNDLRGKPKFADIVESFRDFVGDSKMIAHNAPFDFKFINAEFERCGRPVFDYERMLQEGRAVDTVMMARRKYPGAPASLDALCRRFGIDLSARGTHNALLDCELLAGVYVELMGGRQRNLILKKQDAEKTIAATSVKKCRVSRDRTPRLMTEPDPEALERFRAFIGSIKNPVWQQGTSETSDKVVG